MTRAEIKAKLRAGEITGVQAFELMDIEIQSEMAKGEWSPQRAALRDRQNYVAEFDRFNNTPPEPVQQELGLTGAAWNPNGE